MKKKNQIGSLEQKTLVTHVFFLKQAVYTWCFIFWNTNLELFSNGFPTVWCHKAPKYSTAHLRGAILNGEVSFCRASTHYGVLLKMHCKTEQKSCPGLRCIKVGFQTFQKTLLGVTIGLMLNWFYLNDEIISSRQLWSATVLDCCKQSAEEKYQNWAHYLGWMMGVIEIHRRYIKARQL